MLSVRCKSVKDNNKKRDFHYLYTYFFIIEAYLFVFILNITVSINTTQHYLRCLRLIIQ